LGLDLSSRIFRVASLMGLACSPLPAQQATLPLQEPSRQLPIRAERSAAVSPVAAEEALVKNQLFLLQSARAELVLRGYGSQFEHQLASKAQHVLYDAALELVWFSSERRLWVVDLRESTLAAMRPVLIASNVPHHVEIHVDRGGTDFVEPQDACDLAPFVQLHWTDQPWIEGERGQRLTELDGHAWLARERSRLARAPGEERWFHPSDSHVALPLARAHCEDAERCGAALPFTPPSWELVLTDQSEGADCWHFGCLLRDSATGAFGTPPKPSRWGSPNDMPSGPCGPYRFNADGSAFLVRDLVCTVAGRCHPLDGSTIGWLAPGAILGAPG
jgi:hypothetical protein